MAKLPLFPGVFSGHLTGTLHPAPSIFIKEAVSTKDIFENSKKPLNRGEWCFDF